MAYDPIFHDEIATVSLDRYAALPKTGKPTDQEWTVLSTIVKCHDSNLSVVALATGSKCIGAGSLSPLGDVLNDSHAETLCRRAFLRYIYHQITDLENSEFVLTNGRYKLRGSTTFHFFTTQTPCGDASIFPKDEPAPVHSLDVTSEVPIASEKTALDYRGELDKRHVTGSEIIVDGEETNDPRLKKDNGAGQNSIDKTTNEFKHVVYAKIVSGDRKDKRRYEGEHNERSKKKHSYKDSYRTGAKCLPQDTIKDPLGKGLNFHVTGAVRTKPGRGDRTLSLSCSDKLAKWCFVGVQGSLLALLLDEPVHLASFTIAGGTPYDPKALNRALHDRFPQVVLRGPFRQVRMEAGQADRNFTHTKSEGKRPCPASIIYSNVTHGKKLEVVVEGRRQGVTKKGGSHNGGLPKVCRLELFRSFLAVASKLSVIPCPRFNGTYSSAKSLAVEYVDNWRTVRSVCFKVWTEKDPRLSAFTDV